MKRGVTHEDEGEGNVASFGGQSFRVGWWLVNEGVFICRWCRVGCNSVTTCINCLQLHVHICLI